jgi:putative transposase
MSKTTLQVRLYPTPEQGHLLMSHCQEYISTVNVLASAFESGVLADKVSTKDFRAILPSAVKNQVLRDAQSVYKRSRDRDCLPVLKKPICQWNNQNWRIEEGVLILPVCIDGKHNRYAFLARLWLWRASQGYYASRRNVRSG